MPVLPSPSVCSLAFNILTYKDMKKILTCLLALLGIASACGQKNYEDADVEAFAALVADSSVVVLDVRTAEEFGESHLSRALNVDVKQSDFLQQAKAVLPKDKTIAVYCRSGRRSADACERCLLLRALSGPKR